MRFCILGPLEVWDGGQRLAVGRPQQRALLAVLLLHANRVVSTDRLVAYLWGERPPAAARDLLQGNVARLRRALRTDNNAEGGQPLQTRPPGYLLEVRPGELDDDRFEELAATASRLAGEGSPAAVERAAALLREALSLWRGPALDDVALEVCQNEAARLEERRLAVLEERIEADLRLGRHASLIPELQTAVRTYPLRERLWAQLMTALYRVDRQGDALAAYRELRRTLVDELGIEPSATLQQLQHAMLTGAGALTSNRQESGDSSDEAVDPAAPAQPSPTIVTCTGREQHLKRPDELLADATRAIPAGVICGTAGVVTRPRIVEDSVLCVPAHLCPAGPSVLATDFGTQTCAMIHQVDLPTALRAAGVTAREAEVLDALGARLTNAEIAERLHISVRTIESHVSALLRKLGEPDRRALAARTIALFAANLCRCRAV